MSLDTNNPNPISSPASIVRCIFCRYTIVALVAVICLTRTLSVHNEFSQDAHQAKQDAALTHATHHHNQIKDELNRYTDTLPLMRGFAQANHRVDRAGWNQFINGSNLLESYPAVYAFAFATKVNPQDLQQFVADRHEEGMTDFNIHQHNNTNPVDPNHPLYIVTYEEPEPRNRAALGLNVSANPTNKAIYDRAVDTAQIQLSKPFTLKQQEQESTPSLGIVMALAVYDQSKPLETPDQRREATTGWVAVVLDFDHFLAQSWQSKWNSARMVMTTTNTNNDTVTLLDSANQAQPTYKDQGNLYHQSFDHTIANQTFTNHITLDPLDHGDSATLDTYHHRAARANASLIIGLLVTALITALAWFITTSRARALKIAREMTASLRASEETQREFAHQAQQANAAKTEFLTNMSHELRTPMTAILGYTDILAEMIPLHESPESMRANVHRIKESGDNLLAMINDILDLSIIEEGKLELINEPCIVPQILAEILGNMKPHADHRAIKLTTRFDTPIPATIVADAFRIRQILTNIIFNAIKFTEEGSVTIICSINDQPTNPTITFAINDTGIGIQKEKIDQLFHRFEQSDNSLTRKHGGIGLGLTISKHLAELMQGSLTAKSTINQGSTFSLTIPLNWPENQPRTTITQLTPPPPPNNQSSTRASDQSSNAPVRRHVDHQPLAGHILLVEDGPDNQKLITHFLKKAGATVELAENGQEALDLYNQDQPGQSRFDLIIMDMQMPVLDGYKATSQLRRLACPLPIIALTAHAMQGDREKCLAAGCDDYQTKPINRSKLLQAIRYHIGDNQQSTDQRAA